MLSRGFYDALAFWPIVMWPVIFSSAFHAFVRLCQISQEEHGFSVLNGRPVPATLAWLYVPPAAVFDVTVHAYLLWAIGWWYLAAAVPIYTLGRVVLPALFEGFGPVLLLLPIVHVLFAAAFVVLLGFADVGVLRALNAHLYSLLAGVQVAL